MSTTMQTLCQCSQQLRRQSVRVVNDYADKDKTMRTLSKICKGFSQILIEQSGKTSYLGAVTHTVGII